MTHRLKRAAAAVTLVLLAGCGTTVQQGALGNGAAAGSADGLAPAAGSTAQEPGSTTAAAGGIAAVDAGAEAGRSGSGTAPAADAPGGGSTGPGATSVSGSAASVASGRGFTKTTVKIGFSTAEDASAFASSFGLKGLETGDIKAMIEATVADVNRRGGLAGRRVVPVIHNFNTAELLNDPASAMQAACAAWTQDEHVWAVVNPPQVDGNLLQCLKKASTPLVYASMDFPRTYSPVYAEYPDYFNIDAMLGERYDAVAIGRLAKRGFFEKWDTLNGGPGTMPTKIGVIVTGDASGAALTASYKRQFARYGLKADVVVSCPPSLSDGLSCRQAAGLRFKSDNITHVFGGSVPFMQQAEQQRYRPRYFLDYQPNTFAQNVPAEQLNGAMSESYMPMLDVAQAQDPGPVSPAFGYCLNVMRRAGQQPSSRNVTWYMQTACDGLFFTKAAIDSFGALTDTALRPGYESLGARVPAAMTWATRITPQDHAGVYGLRDLLFKSDCTCFAYTSRTTYTEPSR